MPLRLFCFFILAKLSLFAQAEPAEAIFAGGCFWCMEYEYQEVDGVTDVISGFSGGSIENPVYNGNHEGHYEAIKVRYDPQVISYQDLLTIFWPSIDPFDNLGQFCDKGPSYSRKYVRAVSVNDRSSSDTFQLNRVMVDENWIPVGDARNFQ